MIKMSDIIADIEFLPPFSKVAQKAITILQREDFSMKELSDLIRYDPSLTANILKVANSAAYAKANDISDLQTALTYLGAKQLSRIITISAMKRYFDRHLEGYESIQGEIWEHSISVALISQELVSYEPQIDPEVLFTAALLHDIGKIVLSQYIVNEWDKIQRVLHDQNIDWTTAERKVIGFNHPIVGSAILKKWNFSPTITDVAKYHQEPDRSNSPYVHIVALADYISMLLGRVSQKDAMMYTGYDSLLYKYNIKTDELDQLLSRSSDRIREVLDSFKF